MKKVRHPNVIQLYEVGKIFRDSYLQCKMVDECVMTDYRDREGAIYDYGAC